MEETNLNLMQEEAPAAEQPQESDTVANQMAELKAELEAQFAQMLAEALRVNGMSPEDRAAYEASQREADLEKREREVMRKELRAEAMELLSQRGLPAELADAVSYESRAVMLSAVDSVERCFRRAVQAGVEARLKGELPAAGASAQSADLDALDDASYYRLTMN